MRQHNIALVHDWLVSMRGGEKVLEVLCELFPQATLFTLVHQSGKLSPTIERMNIETSFLQSLPLARAKYQYYLPIFPAAIEHLDLSEFDVVISSGHAAAKGVRLRKGTLHICYCHTPMRYIWDQYEQYFGKGRSSVLTRMIMRMFLPSLRAWDKKTAEGVHHFIANSHCVQERIKRIYGRDSVVIYPPVDVNRFSLSTNDENYFLIVSALVPYKRIDVAVKAFNKLGKKLVIAGTGSELARLKAMAKNNIAFIGWADDERLKLFYEKCRALVFPGEEDFGIVPVEAMACGKPVIAFAAGGALETIVDKKTGLFFGKKGRCDDEQIESLIATIEEIEKMNFDAQLIRHHAMQFERELFKQKLKSYLDVCWKNYFSE